MFSVFEGNHNFHQDERCLTPSHFRDSPEGHVYRGKFIIFYDKLQEIVMHLSRKASILHKSNNFSIFVSYLYYGKGAGIYKDTGTS